MPLIVLPKSCSCRCGPCPPPPSLVWVACFLSFFKSNCWSKPRVTQPHTSQLAFPISPSYFLLSRRLLPLHFQSEGVARGRLGREAALLVRHLVPAFGRWLVRHKARPRAAVRSRRYPWPLVVCCPSGPALEGQRIARLRLTRLVEAAHKALTAAIKLAPTVFAPPVLLIVALIVMPASSPIAMPVIMTPIIITPVLIIISRPPLAASWRSTWSRRSAAEAGHPRGKYLLHAASCTSPVFVGHGGPACAYLLGV